MGEGGTGEEGLGGGGGGEMGDGGGEGGGKPLFAFSITNETFTVPVLYDSNRISLKA